MRLTFNETDRASVIATMNKLDAILQSLPVPNQLIGRDTDLRAFARERKIRGLLTYSTDKILKRAREYSWLVLRGYDMLDLRYSSGWQKFKRDEYTAYLAEDKRSEYDSKGGYYLHELKPECVAMAIRDYPEHPAAPPHIWAYLATHGIFRPR